MSDLSISLGGLSNFISNTVNNAVNSVNDVVAQIDTQLLNGTTAFNIGFLGEVSVGVPVSSGATFNLPSNTGSKLSLNDPAHFQGTINFYAPGGASPGGQPSQVLVAGVPAESWSFSNNVLTLSAGGHPTEALKVIPDPVGFGVYATPSGTVITSSAWPTALPPGDVALPGTTT